MRCVSKKKHSALYPQTERLSGETVILGVLTVLLISVLLVVLLTVVLILLILLVSVLLIVLLTVVILVLIKHSNNSFLRGNRASSLQKLLFAKRQRIYSEAAVSENGKLRRKSQLKKMLLSEKSSLSISSLCFFSSEAFRKYSFFFKISLTVSRIMIRDNPESRSRSEISSSSASLKYHSAATAVAEITAENTSKGF